MAFATSDAVITSGRLSRMALDTKGKRFCDACGRTIGKATRIDQGKEYCATCYKREFVPCVCTICRHRYRQHGRLSSPSPCPKCAKQKRTCARCEKLVPHAGLVLQNGRVVCPSCVSYFKEPEPCTVCGKLSTRLARSPKQGIQERVCASCRLQTHYRTCARCHRYRPIAGVDANKKAYCKDCRPDAPRSHQCPTCHEIIPGAGNGHCRPCLNRLNLQKQATLLSGSLQREWAQKWERLFGDWLGVNKAHILTVVKILNQHHVFFERLEAVYVHPSDVTAQSLLQHFEVDELRRHRLPMRFLREFQGIQLDEADKISQVETARIQEILIKAHGEPWCDVLRGYSEWLLCSGVALRTRRLYVATAALFCRSMNITARDPWTDHDMLQFLHRHPGSRANLFKFTTYVREAYGWAISMPKRSEMGKMRTRMPVTVNHLATLLELVYTRGLKAASARELGRILAKAFGFSATVFSQIPWRYKREGGVSLLMHNNETITVPVPLMKIVDEWIHRRSKTNLNAKN